MAGYLKPRRHFSGSLWLAHGGYLKTAQTQLSIQHRQSMPHQSKGLPEKIAGSPLPYSP
ncbi:hypothetical protein [Eikenella halliae]|uniref:hypothetical protein n=1 Tax=Eikenella halliae TaxID=1795832 RepID=UPI0036203AE4